MASAFLSLFSMVVVFVNWFWFSLYWLWQTQHDNQVSVVCGATSSTTPWAVPAQMFSNLEDYGLISPQFVFLSKPFCVFVFQAIPYAPPVRFSLQQFSIKVTTTPTPPQKQCADKSCVSFANCLDRDAPGPARQTPSARYRVSSPVGFVFCLLGFCGFVGLGWLLVVCIFAWKIGNAEISAKLRCQSDACAPRWVWQVSWLSVMIESVNLATMTQFAQLRTQVARLNTPALCSCRSLRGEACEKVTERVFSWTHEQSAREAQCAKRGAWWYVVCWNGGNNAKKVGLAWTLWHSVYSTSNLITNSWPAESERYGVEFLENLCWFVALMFILAIGWFMNISGSSSSMTQRGFGAMSFSKRDLSTEKVVVELDCQGVVWLFEVRVYVDPAGRREVVDVGQGRSSWPWASNGTSAPWRCACQLTILRMSDSPVVGFAAHRAEATTGQQVARPNLTRSCGRSSLRSKRCCTTMSRASSRSISLRNSNWRTSQFRGSLLALSKGGHLQQDWARMFFLLSVCLRGAGPAKLNTQQSNGYLNLTWFVLTFNFCVIVFV